MYDAPRMRDRPHTRYLGYAYPSFPISGRNAVASRVGTVQQGKGISIPYMILHPSRWEKVLGYIDISRYVKYLHTIPARTNKEG